MSEIPTSAVQPLDRGPRPQRRKPGPKARKPTAQAAEIADLLHEAGASEEFAWSLMKLKDQRALADALVLMGQATSEETVLLAFAILAAKIAHEKKAKAS